MKAESKNNPNNIGDKDLTYYCATYTTCGDSVGLFQIRIFPDRPAPQWLLNPENNVRYAAQLQSQQGWCPWSTAKKIGLCK